MARYFVHNLEEDRLHIHTGGKSDWLTIPENDRNEIKRACLWSKSRNCWLSRAKGRKALIYIGDALKRAGFEDRGEDGEKLSYAEQVEAKQQKAEDRADRMENRAEKAETLGNRLHETAHQMASAIPFGQPILVGHHSEHRDRNYRDRIHNTFGKAFNELDKAKHYEGRAATARQTAEGAQFSNPTYLGKRIAEAETEERLIQRRLEGKFYEHSEPETISEAYRDQLNERLAEIQDKLGFLRHCLETCGVKTFTRESLKGMKEVLIRRSWQEIVKLNPKTVSVPNICFPSPESQRKWAMKYPYCEVKDAR